MPRFTEDDIDDAVDRAKDLVTSRVFLVSAAIFLVAFVPRIMLWEHGLWPDEAMEMLVTQNILEGEGVQRLGKIMNSPRIAFYALIGLGFLIFGQHTWVAVGIVAALGALTAVVAYLFGREVYSEYAGIAAGVLLVFSPIHWSVSTRILTDVPVTFFMFLAAYLFYRSEHRNEARTFYLAVVAAVLAVFTKLTGLIILPILGLYALYRHRLGTFRIRRYWIGIGSIVGLFGLWEARNLLVVGETVLFRGVRVFFGLFNLLTGADRSASTGPTAGNFNDWYYLENMSGVLGTPVLLLFGLGILAVMMYDGRPFRAAKEQFGSRIASVLAAGAATGVLALISGVIIGSSSVTIFGLFLFLTTTTVLFVEYRSVLLLLYLITIFTIFTFKTYNTMRYFLPFVPMAVVLAGFGADAIRRAATVLVNNRAGQVVFLALLVLVSWNMYPAMAGSIQSQHQSYSGYKEAGEWISQNVDPDEEILTASIKQIVWYSGHTNATPLLSVKESPEQLEQYVRENDVKYIQMDAWEFTLPKWQRTYFQPQNGYEPVKVVRVNGRPVVVIFRVTDQVLNGTE